MYLSRARLRSDSAVSAIAPLLLPSDSNYGLLAAHRMVWSLMSDGPSRTRDFLWREEQPGRFLILAPRPANGGGLFDVESKPWEPALRPGDRLGFLLRANSTIARSPGPGIRGKRLDVVGDAVRSVPPGKRAAERPAIIVNAGREWLARQGDRAGFVPDADTFRVDGYDWVRIPREDRQPAVEFGRLDFEGVLEVRDPAAFLAAVIAGFGRARAFGCGLLLLRRV
jgi:CRISPR system Cascade subunit CasE